MEKIHAWIYNPDHALIKGMSKKAALFVLHCEDPSKCDLHKECNSCLLQGGMTGCRFGSKVKTEGFTKQARKYSDWMQKAKADNAEYFDRLSDRRYGGIFKTNGYWYLPYAHMSGIWGERYPLGSQWIPESEMNSELLAKICTAMPTAMMGGFISAYQKEVIPKFLHDIQTRYPELFDMLPDDQKNRIENISHVGRKADIKTCTPGVYKFGSSTWEWDGDSLIGGSMLFQPVKGEIKITIRPEDGQAVTITDDCQVTPDTQFLD